MDWITSNSELMMERSMQFLWTKQTAILNNISNVETPNYKTKYVTFEETLRRNLVRAAEDGESTASIRERLDNAGAMVRTAESESTRMDGNGVNMTEQGVELARNSYQLQYTMSAITGNYNILRTAIKGQ